MQWQLLNPLPVGITSQRQPRRRNDQNTQSCRNEESSHRSPQRLIFWEGDEAITHLAIRESLFGQKTEQARLLD
jgi:hypothetical protein